MRDRIILLLVSCLVFSCTKQDVETGFIHKYFFENGVKVHGRFINDSIRDGVFTYYYPSGEIGRVIVYENNLIMGPIIELTERKKIISYGYSSEKMTEFQFSFNEEGDTTSIILNNLVKSYSIDGSGRPTFYYLDSMRLGFDSLGNVNNYVPPLTFLTKKDSSDLNRSYPNWEEQVKSWGNR